MAKPVFRVFNEAWKLFSTLVEKAFEAFSTQQRRER